MKRRGFLTTTGLAAVGTAFAFGIGRSKLPFLDLGNTALNNPARVSEKLEQDFVQLVHWLTENGWAAYLEQNLDVNLKLERDALKAELTKELNNAKLSTLREKPNAGFDDFTGTSLIKPGFPAFSLLYHALASPRVKSDSFKAYPELEQLDLLENYIYALADWNNLKQAHNITSEKDLVFAVFAYEYRPAFKTPHHEHADLVFSRTGIARIGNQPVNYDKINRCFINKPNDPAKIKQVAVTPARFGLFLARRANYNEIDLMKTDKYQEGGFHNDKDDHQKTFLHPIRKIFNNDLLVGESSVVFFEKHKNEKLCKLSKSKKITILDSLQPQGRTNAVEIKAKESPDLIVQGFDDRNVGSSFLVISQPNDLIRIAKSGTRNLFFKVPPEAQDNRYFTAFSTQEVENIELAIGNHRTINGYDAPRNQAMFVNITHRYFPESGTYKEINPERNKMFEKVISAGNYYAPLFEDSICDGQVNVEVSLFKSGNLEQVSKVCLPAFSIVTAPDFFPQVDPLDLVDFDIAPGISSETNFYEGGVASLASARIRPSPKALNSQNDPAKYTFTSVLSGKRDTAESVSTQDKLMYRNPKVEKGYYVSGHLPDVSSSVFAPGWDVTYSRDEELDKEIYIGTEGLGSPFIEDMKFCAALNGMWPATSPDASRTYQGAHEPHYRNPTAVPLLDEEIGFHKNSPCTDPAKVGSYGWDGEQGPFLQMVNGKWKVNFTDLGRANAIQNTIRGNVDMSKLRELTSAELIGRMESLKLCIQKLPLLNFRRREQKNKMVAYTYLWLVSAEKVNWGTDNANGFGIPHNLIGKSKDWITNKSNAKVRGDGYLFVFVDSAPDNSDDKDWVDQKRRRLLCNNIFICQIAGKDVRWMDVIKGPNKWNS